MRIFLPNKIMICPSETEKWWEHVPLSWEVTTVEYGSRERGIVNRIPKETWRNAHNRRWSGQLHFWSSKNAHVHRLEKNPEFRATKEGFTLNKSGKSDYLKPKSIPDVYDCLCNWR